MNNHIFSSADVPAALNIFELQAGLPDGCFCSAERNETGAPVRITIHAPEGVERAALLPIVSGHVPTRTEEEAIAEREAAALEAKILEILARRGVE